MLSRELGHSVATMIYMKLRLPTYGVLKSIIKIQNTWKRSLIPSGKECLECLLRGASAHIAGANSYKICMVPKIKGWFTALSFQLVTSAFITVKTRQSMYPDYDRYQQHGDVVTYVTPPKKIPYPTNCRLHNNYSYMI